MKTSALLAVAAVAAFAGNAAAFSETHMDNMLQDVEAFENFNYEDFMVEDEATDAIEDISDVSQEEIEMHGLESANYFHERQTELRGKTFGVDYSTYFPVSTIQCLKRNGYVFAIPRGYQSIGRVDPNLAANVRNARAGGMKYVDAYIFPCPTCGNPAGQISAIVNYIKANKLSVGMLWLDIEGTQYWYNNINTNRNFFNNLLSASARSGFKTGIYSSRYQWQGIFGNGFTSGGNYPLWYAHYDNNASFSDWVRFGGFARPAIKQYLGDKVVCGGGVDLNVY